MINPALLGKFLKVVEAVNTAQKIYKERTTPENQAKLDAAVKEASAFFKTRGPELATVVQGWLGKSAMKRADAIIDSPDVSTEALSQLLEQLADRARTGDGQISAAEGDTFDAVAARLRNLAKENERLSNETFTAQAKDTFEKVKSSETGQRVLGGLAKLRETLKTPQA